MAASPPPPVLGLTPSRSGVNVNNNTADVSRLEAAFDSDSVLSSAFATGFRAPAIRRNFVAQPEAVKIEEVNKQLSVLYISLYRARCCHY
jgi:hypothetical protein